MVEPYRIGYGGPDEKLTVREALLVLLDCVGYDLDACAVNEMVGAVLPADVLAKCRKSLERNRL